MLTAVSAGCAGFLKKIFVVARNKKTPTPENPSHPALIGINPAQLLEKNSDGL